ncbi:rho GTPase-activating protein 12 isoform X1, partial [Lates japonicus]
MQEVAGIRASKQTTSLARRLLLPSFRFHRPISLRRRRTPTSTYSSQSDGQYGSPPRGWSEEMDEHGHTLYVSDYTNEK